ncbi:MULTISPECIES: hypothetical protein [unclassified Streptomyces]|uniref:hypothetical protein n=1 Tax=unclassified Streptomyces TaxID=2593676 RepID=UPI002E18E97A
MTQAYDTTAHDRGAAGVPLVSRTAELGFLDQAVVQGRSRPAIVVGRGPSTLTAAVALALALALVE